MDIMQRAWAGTLESSDLLVEVMPYDGPAVDIEIESTVSKQFEPLIRQTVGQMLEEMRVSGVRIVVNDKGALDCVIRARVQAAVMRAANTVGEI